MCVCACVCVYIYISMFKRVNTILSIGRPVGHFSLIGLKRILLTIFFSGALNLAKLVTLAATLSKKGLETLDRELRWTLGVQGLLSCQG